MHDIEKNRVEYVGLIEKTLSHLTAEHDKFKKTAEYWEPKFTAVRHKNGTAFSLEMGGKVTHCTITPEYLLEADLTSGVSTVLEALVENLVLDLLRKELTPEFERVQLNATATIGAGKW